MNTLQILYLQCGLGALLATAIFLLYYGKVFTKTSQLRMVKASSSSIGVLALFWGFLLCGVVDGSISHTVQAAFSLETAAANPWGMWAAFRVFTVALGLSIAPWVVGLVIFAAASGGFL